MMFFELGCSGHFEMSVFHGLSAGNTCKAARISSAFGVLNITGLSIFGIFGRGRPLECLAVGAFSRVLSALAMLKLAAKIGTQQRTSNLRIMEASSKRFLVFSPGVRYRYPREAPGPTP